MPNEAQTETIRFDECHVRVKTRAQSATPCARVLHMSLWVEQTGGKGEAVKGVSQGLTNGSVCVLMMFWVTELRENTAAVAPAFPSPTLKSLDILFVPMFVTVGSIITGGVAVLDLFQRLFDLSVTHPCCFSFIHCTGSWFTPRLLRRRQTGGKEVFPGM